MSQLGCLLFIVSCFVVTIGFMVVNVKLLGRPLRRTANRDIQLAEDSGEPKFKLLTPTINGLITIEAAFASVTVAVLFVVVGIIMAGASLPEVLSPIVMTAIAALAIATVCWILSLELLSHLISPSFSEKGFGPVYMEALNLWNLGLMLLLLALCVVLIPVGTGVAAAVATITSFLAMRALALAHEWGPVTLKKMDPEEPMSVDPVRKNVPPWALSAALGGLAVLFALLYTPLNHAIGSVRYMVTPIDDWIPLWPVFVLVYLSYFAYILATIIITLVRRDRATFNRFALALLFTLGVSYLAYGFFQTGMHRPDLIGSSWNVEVLRYVYGNDNPYNAFPSSHASITTVCCLALQAWPRARPVMITWAILIIASTVLVKQHYFADAVAGTALGAVSFWIAGHILPAPHY